MAQHHYQKSILFVTLGALLVGSLTLSHNLQAANTVRADTTEQHQTIAQNNIAATSSTLSGNPLNASQSETTTPQSEITTDFIDATDITVNVGTDYLLNNQATADTTKAVAILTPATANAAVTWGVDDSSVATIDPKSGLITANTIRRNGVVTVTATVTNHNGATLTASKRITIGGGLTNQTAIEGNPATFKIQKDITKIAAANNVTLTSIVWHKIANSIDTVAPADADQDDLSYTIPSVSYSDNNQQ
ncbi:hypothetical protein [Lapidilactobacillus wuchangensis]|uniref:hypothetical protein n=1 Tax=Lapidilactobacillus wuchangensis TaxID=2486001 RepID=UPI000F79FA1E|nr:hypothetical protein [Lapidilactobacillus wuchangensis]